MIQNDDYIEFDLKALVFYILRCWKPLLAVSLGLALLLGGLMAWSEHNTALEMDMTSSYWMEYQQYQNQTAFFEDRVTTTQDKIDALQDYITNSVLMKTDHRNVHIAKATYYVDSGYQILPENTFQNPDKTPTLVWHYRNYLSDYSLFEEIGEEVGIEAKYLMELVEVSIPDDYTLAISVSHPTMRFANTIMEVLQDKLHKVHLHLNDTVGTHSITQMMNSCGVYVDEELKETQQEALDELLELQDDMITYNQELITLKEGPAPGELNIVTAFIKWFILGGALGVFLVAFWLFASSILKNRLHAASQLSSGFQATVLGEVVRSGDRLPAITRTVSRMEGCLTENSEENIRFLAENIRNHGGDAGNILLCSDCDAALCASLAQSLDSCLPGIRIRHAGDLLKEAEALRALAECDAVVMVSVRDLSRNTGIKKMLTLIRSYRKEVLGFIVAN